MKILKENQVNVNLTEIDLLQHVVDLFFYETIYNPPQFTFSCFGKLFTKQFYACEGFSLLAFSDRAAFCGSKYFARSAP